MFILKIPTQSKPVHKVHTPTPPPTPTQHRASWTPVPFGITLSDRNLVCAEFLLVAQKQDLETNYTDWVRNTNWWNEIFEKRSESFRLDVMTALELEYWTGSARDFVFVFTIKMNTKEQNTISDQQMPPPQIERPQTPIVWCSLCHVPRRLPAARILVLVNPTLCCLSFIFCRDTQCLEYLAHKLRMERQ